jgi:hypothetical protein
MGPGFVRWAALQAAAVVLLAGCTVLGEMADLPYSPCPQTPDGEAVAPTRYTYVSPPYTGPGPHPVHIDEMGPVENEASPAAEVPQEWLAPPAEGYDFVPDPEVVQLAVCRYLRVGDEVDECSYSSVPGSGASMRVPLVEAVHIFHVREVGSGDRVGGFELAGTEGVCPDDYYAGGPGPERVVLGVDEEELREALRHLVEDAV